MATRLYMVANSTPPVTPDIDAWTSTTGAVRRMLSLTKAATTEQLQVNIPATAGQNGLVAQFISEPLEAQTISGTVSLVFRVRELLAEDNMNKRWRSIRVINSAGVTVATLDPLVATSSTTEISAITLQGQQHANGSGFTSYACAAGDRLLVAVGYGTSTANAVTPQVLCEWGGNGTDHTNVNADTTGTVPWVEFSQNLVFQADTTSVSSDVDLRWQVDNTVSQTTDLRWSVASRVQNDVDARWRVFGTATQDADLRWRTFVLVANSLDVRWRSDSGGTTPVSQTVDVRWRSLAQAAATTDLRWRSAAQVSATLDARWRVAQQVSGTVDLRWSSASGGATSVSASLDARWRSLAQAVATLDARWRTANTVAATTDLRWAVQPSLASVSQAVDLRWRAMGQVVQTSDLRWRVRNLTGVSLDLLWRSRSQVSGDLDLRWRLAVVVTRDAVFPWRHFGQVLVDLSLLWRNLESTTPLEADAFVALDPLRAKASLDGLAIAVVDIGLFEGRKVDIGPRQFVVDLEGL